MKLAERQLNDWSQIPEPSSSHGEVVEWVNATASTLNVPYQLVVSGSSANMTAVQASDLDVQVVLSHDTDTPRHEQRAKYAGYKDHLLRRFGHEIGTAHVEDANKCIKIGLGKSSVDVVLAYSRGNDSTLDFWTNEGRPTRTNSAWYRATSDSKDKETDDTFRAAARVAKSARHHLGSSASSYAMERSVWAVPSTEFTAKTLTERMQRVGKYIVTYNSPTFQASMNRYEIPGIPLSDYGATINTWRAILAHL